MTSSKPHRDPDTGQIKMNGRVGAFFAWLEWAGKIAILPVVVYLVGHAIHHARLSDFMGVGPRLTPAMLEERLSQHDLEMFDKISQRYPPRELISKVDANSADLGVLKVQVARLDERMVSLDARISTEFRAIRSLLGD